MEIWQNLGKKRNTDSDFPRPYTNELVGAENEKYFNWKELLVAFHSQLDTTQLLPESKATYDSIQVHVWNHMVPCDNFISLPCMESYGTGIPQNQL